MKKEIIAFISGAVIVGAIWAGMTIFSNKADAPVTDIPGNTTTTAPSPTSLICSKKVYRMFILQRRTKIFRD